MGKKKSKKQIQKSKGVDNSNRSADQTTKKTKTPPKAAEPDFFNFIFKDKSHKKLLLLTVVINVVLFALYKYCIPMPDFFPDSHSYVLAATRQLEVFYRPYGYAQFLNFLHGFSSSALFTVGVQYFLLMFSALFCFFSVDYLFHFANKKIKLLSWLLLSINPILLVIGNQVASDSLFAALTVIWFTLMLWVFQKGKWWALLIQLLVLYWAFTVRYNALYYPLVAIGVFLISRKRSFIYSSVGIIATVAVVGLTYSSIKKTTERVTGAPVFAGFSGWQMANNALVVYAHLDSVSSDEFDDPQLKLFNQFVQVFIDSAADPEKLNQVKAGKLPGGTFLWDTKSPLKQFLFFYIDRYRIPYIQSWYQVSLIYNEFGKQVILSHPGTYFRYYLLNNIGLYFAPHKEFMEQYHVSAGMPKDTKEWFHFKEDFPVANYPKVQEAIVSVYPFVHAVLTCFCLLIPLFYLVKRKKLSGRWEKNFTFPVLFWYLFFLTNMGFGLLASAITLRYEIVWFILDLILPFWFLDQLLLKKEMEPAVQHAKRNG